jgi:branched-chain amino acid aminotransferase
MPATLFAVEDAGPRPLPVPAGVDGFGGLYDGLELGVYEALRTFHHDRFLGLDEHLTRLEQSISRLGWDYHFDDARMRRCIQAVCTEAPFDEMRVRFDVLAAPAVSRGSVSRELIALVPFSPVPGAVYEQGVAVVTTTALSRHAPEVKTADFVEQRRRIEAQTPDAYERLIVSARGEVLEGFSSNFYVVRGGVLITAGEGVLEGVTRRTVLELARARGIRVRLEPPVARDLPHIQEAAISSSSRGLVPVVRIDGRAVGDGAPGPVIGGLVTDYQAFVQANIKPAV